MAILKVAQIGHPVLRLVARPVTAEEIASAAFQAFCDDLLETMDEYDGTGLAAPQVHASLRVVVLSLDGEREPEFLINPRIEVLTEETSSMMEGCLSIAGMRARVWRPNHIRVHALDRDGTPKAYELEGFPAVVTQHECDHLDGILYVDRCDTRTLAFMDEYKRFGPVDEWLAEAELPSDEVDDVDDVEAAHHEADDEDRAVGDTMFPDEPTNAEITEIAPRLTDDDHTEVELR
jgi:peptide deformylase